MAASNYLTAAPALVAARRLGLPFYYEVRGLWEITRASSEREFGDTPAFRVEKILETSVAARADRVFTLNEALREELVSRGIAGDRITLLPNSVDPAQFAPLPRDEALAARLGLPGGVPVIGYVGTFAEHEGLDDLARACGLLKQSGVEFRLLLVGNENASGEDRGPITMEIRRIAEAARFSGWLVMPGRVPHEQVAAYYSLIDIAPFPRKPLPVCEIVSPLKPLEALAMEKAVVASSVRALSEMIRDGETGLVFEKGSVESLAGKLRALIDAPELRAGLGRRGRAWVCSERTWARIGTRFDGIAGPPPA
jgi:glycosyltransferase involved in cell wall biosynthesis